MFLLACTTFCITVIVADYFVGNKTGTVPERLNDFKSYDNNLAKDSGHKLTLELDKIKNWFGTEQKTEVEPFSFIQPLVDHCPTVSTLAVICGGGIYFYMYGDNIFHSNLHEKYYPALGKYVKHLNKPFKLPAIEPLPTLHYFQ